LSPAIAYNGPMTSENPLRASDWDREQTADRLRHAAVEGRLFPDELEERLRAAFAARTYGELAAVVRDLPAPDAPSGTTRSALTLRPTAARWRPLVAGVVALAALLLILLALGVTMRRHESLAGPMPTITSPPTPNTQP
jgi:hypothetical protein